MGLDANDNRGWVMSGVAGIGAFSSSSLNLSELKGSMPADDVNSLCYRRQHHLRGHYIAIMFSNTKLRYYYQHYLSFLVHGPECWSHGRFSPVNFLFYQMYGPLRVPGVFVAL